MSQYIRLPIVASSAPAGGATAANQVLEIAELTTIASNQTNGSQVVVGAGTAGTPAGGVVSVQGVSGGTAVGVTAASLPLPTGAATQATLAAFSAKSQSNFINNPFDSTSITYVASGNGVGQIATVLFYLGGLSGTLVNTLTMGYNSSNQLISVVKS